MTHRAKIKKNNCKENHRDLHWEEYWTMVYTSNKKVEVLNELNNKWEDCNREYSAGERSIKISYT